MAKSQSAIDDRHWFESTLKGKLNDQDNAAWQEGIQLTSKWTTRGSFVGTFIFAVVGFPYPRTFTSTFYRTMRGIRSSTLSVPHGSTPFKYSMAQAHHQARETQGVRELKAGKITAGRFQLRLIAATAVGMAWALLGGVVGRAAGALVAVPFAGRVIERNGGDVKRIERAAIETADEYKRRKLGDDESEGGAAGSLRKEESAFLEMDQRATSQANANEAAVPSDGGKVSKSRWEELRQSKTAAPSAWERIRQEQGREAISSSKPAAPSDATVTTSAQPERDERRKEFEVLMEKERQGGEEAKEVIKDSKSTRWL